MKTFLKECASRMVLGFALIGFGVMIVLAAAVLTLVPIVATVMLIHAVFQ